MLYSLVTSPASASELQLLHVGLLKLGPGTVRHRHITLNTRIVGYQYLIRPRSNDNTTTCEKNNSRFENDLNSYLADGHNQVTF